MMMNAIRNSSRLALFAFVLLLAASGCKSKKKAMEAQAAEKARMEQEAALKRQQEEDEQKRKEAEAQARRDEEAKSKASTPYVRLGQYFESIANSGSLTSANTSISEALTMFASPDTPVLIIISESGGQKDYDRPTTIISYLNYLKDQKKSMNKVEKLVFDASGKITEVELRKNF
jgi:hypothetical protein